MKDWGGGGPSPCTFNAFFSAPKDFKIPNLPLNKNKKLISLSYLMLHICPHPQF